nr:stage II sporulation protein P [uncultured Merdimonas sp.]
MSRKHRVNRLLILGTGCILGIYACINLSGVQADQISGKALGEISQIILSEAAKTYLTGMTYQKGEKETAGAWIAGKAMDLIPIGTYAVGRLSVDTDVEDGETYEKILAQQENDENAVDENGNLIGEDKNPSASVETSAPAIDTSMEKLSNYEYLLGNFYTVDSSTMADPELLNAQKLLGKDLKIDENAKGPKILIYHTHSQETFADSVPGDTSTSILGIGEYLSQLLNETYGIETMHHQGVYDLIDGKLDRSMAYQLAEPEIAKILEENPSIEVVIDLHRDGVAEGTHLVTDINGKPTAQIMFFNGLSRSRANGEIGYLANPYIEDNLAFSLQMQIAATQKYPGFTRHIYLRAYRYNMHLAPKTLLIEAGAQTNTVEEMRNAMEVLADTLDSVLTG